MKKSFKDYWKKAWHFVWHEDSFASLVVNIFIAIILIKFIIYPGLGLVLGTNFPIVAVVSSSMEHHPSGFEDWWQQEKPYYLQNGIYEEQFKDYPFNKGFNKGDIMFLTGKDPALIQVGDVVVFQSIRPIPIIHRVVAKDADSFVTKGDNNRAPNKEIGEDNVLYEQVLGKASFRIPYLGYVKILFVDLLNLLGLGGLVQG